jgi:Cysteine-rich secretory protein family
MSPPQASLLAPPSTPQETMPRSHRPTSPTPRRQSTATRALANARGEEAATLEALESRQLLSFDPTPAEQYMLELSNRFRLNPQAELALLTSALGEPARSIDADVDSALRFFRVSGSLLRSQWTSLRPAQPLAWNQNLYRAAEFHSQEMINQDAQEHQLPGEADLGGRATAFNYTNWSTLGENIYAYARSIDHGHAGFLLDWGDGPGGIQSPPGHRNTLINDNFREVGIRVLNPGRRTGKETGPLVITQDFGRRFNQGSPFLLGVAFGDANGDRAYSLGEGVPGVTITAVSTATPGPGTSPPTFTTTTMSAGGWQMQVPAGRYNVTFTGGPFRSGVTYADIVVSSSNVKVDAQVGVTPPAPVLSLTGNATTILANDTVPSRADFTDLGNANLTNQTIIRSFIITNTGNRALTFASTNPVRITGSSSLGLSDFRIVQSTPAELEPGQSATIQIQFDPSALGLRQAVVNLVSNDLASPTFTFAIQGRGVQRAVAEVSGRGVLIPHADTSPTTSDWTSFAGVNYFGSVTALSPLAQSKVRIFTLTNRGLLPLTFTQARIVESTTAQSAGLASDPGAFEIFSAPAGTLSPGQSTQIRIRFTPTAPGFNHVTLNLTTSDPVAPTYSIDLRGNGLPAARLDILGNGALILNGSTTPTLSNRTDFGVVAELSGSRARLFTLRNSGSADLRFASVDPVQIITGESGEFSLALAITPGLVLRPGELTTLRVRFDPIGLGPRQTTIQILSSDPLAPDFEFAIRGVGV